MSRFFLFLFWLGGEPQCCISIYLFILIVTLYNKSKRVRGREGGEDSNRGGLFTECIHD
jgi:hypothetical protein